MDSDNKKLRILFFTPWYPTTDDPVGGVFVHELCRSVAGKADVKVAVISFDDSLRMSQILLTNEFYDGVEVLRVRQGRGSIPKLRFIGRLFSQVWLLKKLIAEFKPDLVHATTYHATIPAVLAAKDSFLPVIATEHYSGFYRGKVRGLEKLKARWGLRRADRLIAISHYMKSLLKLHGIKANYETLPIGIDTALFRPADRVRDANAVYHGIMVATLTPIKGYPVLLEALALLRTHHLLIHIHIVGSGEERSMLEQKVSTLGIADMVTFHGVLGKVDLAKLMQQSDFALTSSLGETFGVAVAEGLACGLPTVATKVGALPELIDESCGLLVKAGDPASLAAGIIALTDNLASYDRSAIGALIAAKLSHEAVSDRFIQICKELTR